MSELKEQIEFLRNYNKWHRGDETVDMPHPREIGKALDSLTNGAENLERENAELKAEILRAELLVLQGSSGFEKEIIELRQRLATACERIRDILEGDDGQAWKEARTFLRRIGEPASIAEKKRGEVEQRGLWRWHNAEPEQNIPEELFDENAVYDELTQAERRYTTPAAVSAVLDATVSLIRMGIKKGGEV